MNKNNCCSLNFDSNSSLNYRESSKSNVFQEFKRVAKIQDVAMPQKAVPNKQKKDSNQEQPCYEFNGYCPFQKDCKNVITINPMKNIFYCRKCHAGGNIIDALALSRGCVTDCNNILSHKGRRNREYTKEEWRQIAYYATQYLNGESFDEGLSK